MENKGDWNREAVTSRSPGLVAVTTRGLQIERMCQPQRGCVRRRATRSGLRLSGLTYPKVETTRDFKPQPLCGKAVQAKRPASISDNDVLHFKPESTT